MCPLCRAVQKGREADGRHQQPAVSPVERVTLLACQPAEFVISRPPAREWPEMIPARAPSWSQPVPLPPPKAGLV
jgi:hypothetical protein